MAGKEEEIGVKITASTAGLTDGMAQATSSVKQAVTQMEGHFAGLAQTVNNLKTPFLALSAVLAGGALFKDAVDETIKWNGESIKLASTLGITTQEASVLNLALGDIHSSSEEYIHAAQIMTRQLNSGGEGFRKLGIETKDANGNLKPTGQLMQEVLGRLGEMEQGTSRNAAGTAIFGRSWGEAQKLLKLSTEVMQEAKEKAEKLNLVVGGDAVEAQKRYKAAMNDLQDVGLGFKVALGGQLLPVLAELAQVLADLLPPAIKAVGFVFGEVMGVISTLKGAVFGLFSALKDALLPIFQSLTGWMGDYMPTAGGILMFVFRGLSTAIEGIALTIKILITLGKTFVEDMIAGFTNLGTVISRVLHGDFEGAKKAIARADEEMTQRHGAALDKIVSDSEDAKARIDKIWAPDEKRDSGPTKVGKQGEESFDPGSGNKVSIVDEFQKELDAQKQAYLEATNYLGEFAKEKERDFWQGKLGEVNEGSEEEGKIQHKLTEVKIEIAKEGLERQKATTALEIQQAEHDSAKKVDVARKAYEQLKNQLGENHKEVIEAHRRLEAEEQKHADRMLEIQALQRQAVQDARLATLDLEEESLKLARQMEEIDAQQELEGLRRLEEKRFQIKLEAAKREATLEKDPVKRQERLNQIAQLEQQHALKVKQIESQAALETQKRWNQVASGIGHTFASVVAGLVRGTVTWANAFRSTTQGVLNTFVNMGEEMLADWLRKLVTQTVSHRAQKTAQAATDAATNASAVASGKLAATSEITANAGVAAAAAMGSVAAIPLYGWALAPEVGAATFATAIAYLGSIASAAGGYDIPANVNPLVQAHAQEMILPAKHANTIRRLGDLIEQGGGGSLGQGGDTYHFSASFMDARGAEDFLRRNQGPIVRVMKDAARNRRIG